MSNKCVVIVLGLCLVFGGGGSCDDKNVLQNTIDDAAVGFRLKNNSDRTLNRNKRFIVVTGEGVPEYDDVDEDVPFDYDYWYDYDNDDDIDDDDHHHVWWHFFHHHSEPHLPFPLLPPTFVYRRPVRRGCDKWPFACRNTYEVILWLQCYHEFAEKSHGIPVLPVHAWKKK